MVLLHKTMTKLGVGPDDAVAQQDIDAQHVVVADAAENGDNDVNAPNGPEQAMEHES